MDTSSGLCHEKNNLSVPVRVRVSNFFLFFKEVDLADTSQNT